MSRFSAVPESFRPLYSELDSSLALAERSVKAMPSHPGGPAPLWLPALYPASSMFGPVEKDSPKWRELLDAADAFKALGADGVSIMISFPALTPEAGDTAPLLAFYRELAFSLRARGMKLMVETFVYPSSVATRPAAFVRGLNDLSDPRGTYLALRLNEAVLVAREIAPDYLSLVTEPATFERFSGIPVSAGEYAAWIETAVPLIHSASGGKVRVGAGAGAWEDATYVKAFAAVPGLDYLDIHFYPLSLGDRDCFASLAAVVAEARSIAPGIGVVIGETWLYKHAALEKGGVFNVEAYGRNGYSFWAPLDGRFFALMYSFSVKAGVAAVAPYFPQLFFHDIAFNRSFPVPKWPACLLDEWALALPAMRAGKASPAGEAFRRIVGKRSPAFSSAP